MNRELNCLSYWHPKLVAAGIPVPRTEIVFTDCKLNSLLDGKFPHGWPRFLRDINAARLRIGGDVFLRTGQGSGKHQWANTCYVPSNAAITRHVSNLVEWSAMVDFMGLPTDIWAVRELLPTKPIGICPRYRGMPVCREYRYFVQDGAILCAHPYWPEKALREGGFEGVIPEEWAFPPSELNCLAERVSQAIPGHWSVDLLETSDGWYVTDMAVAGQSFHWPGCVAAQIAQDEPQPSQEAPWPTSCPEAAGGPRGPSGTD